MQALEDRVRSLAEEIAVLRGEVKALREAKSPDAAAAHVVLASNVVPDSLPISPAPAVTPSEAAQIPQTQTTGGTQMQNPPGLGGATSNAKLLNPDISLIGDFVGTAGRNIVTPSRSLELHESEVGMQAIIDAYARGEALSPEQSLRAREIEGGTGPAAVRTQIESAEAALASV